MVLPFFCCRRKNAGQITVGNRADVIVKRGGIKWNVTGRLLCKMNLNCDKNMDFVHVKVPGNMRVKIYAFGIK